MADWHVEYIRVRYRYKEIEPKTKNSSLSACEPKEKDVKFAINKWFKGNPNYSPNPNPTQ